jgi:glycosyltransferase involved in cell wall biosynthesis
MFPVVHIVQRMAPGGIETLVLDLVRSGNGNTMVFSLEGQSGDLVAAWPALQPISDHLIGFGWQGGIRPALVARLREALRRHHARAVVVHHIGPYLYGGLAALLAGVATIVHVEHDAWHFAAPRRRVLTRALEAILRPTHVAVSRSVASALARIVPAAGIHVIPNGIDLGLFAPGDRDAARILMGVEGNQRIIGAIGRLLPVKGHDLLIKAMTCLPSDVSLVIAGAGPASTDLQQLARDLDVDTRVLFLGHRDDVHLLLPGFDVFCLPSRSEGFPRSVVEAQACGIPVVATDVGGLREAVCPDTGRIVPTEDVPSLVDALLSRLSTPLRRSPRDFVSARFPWSATQAAYAELVEARHAA